MLRPISRRRALLAALAGLLLVLVGIVSTEDTPGSRGSAVPTASAVAADRAVAPPASSRVGERVGSSTDRTAPGPGDHLAVGPAVGDLGGPAFRSTLLERAAGTAPSRPRAAFGARAPPAS